MMNKQLGKHMQAGIACEGVGMSMCSARQGFSGWVFVNDGRLCGGFVVG